MTATNALRKLYQGKDTFHKFWAEFQRLTAELEISPESIIAELKYRVSYDLQTAIVTEINIASVYELTQKCIAIDQNLQ
jgi:hypothetical protein